MPVLVLLAVLLVGPEPVRGQLPAERIDAAWLDSLPVPPLEFDIPEPAEYGVEGVPVFVQSDSALPLVDLFVTFEGGYVDLPRDLYAAAVSLPLLLRSGGTAGLPPDSVDLRIERLAIQLSFGGGGGGIGASLNTPTSGLEPALDLFGEMIARPAFDPGRIEVWRGQELEAVRRRADDPGTLAFSTFNRLLHGNHPVGWEIGAADLAPDRYTRAALLEAHERIVCRERMLLGVAGDVRWESLRPHLADFVARVPPCDTDLPEAPTAEVGAPQGVWIVPRDLEQSTVILAHPSGLREGPDPDYFASRIGNSILGASGFSSRLMQEVRTARGLAYGVSSLWTTPRTRDGLIGAVVRTGPATTVEAIGVILETLRGMAESAPTEEEVATERESLANGWVFNFDTPAAVVNRRMALRAADLPDDWLERWLEEIQRVRPEEIRRVYERWLRPDEMVILVVGDPDRIGPGLERFGPVRTLDPDSLRIRPRPSGSPRSRR